MQVEEAVDLLLALLDAQEQINQVLNQIQKSKDVCDVDKEITQEWVDLSDETNANIANILAAMQTAYETTAPKARNLNDRHLKDLADCPDGKFCRASVQARLVLIENQNEGEDE